jgi:hypothetical protein
VTGAIVCPPFNFFGMLTILAAGVVVAFLYFGRDVIVPITLAILLSFLLAVTYCGSSSSTAAAGCRSFWVLP